MKRCPTARRWIGPAVTIQPDAQHRQPTEHRAVGQYPRFTHASGTGCHSTRPSLPRVNRTPGWRRRHATRIREARRHDAETHTGRTLASPKKTSNAIKTNAARRRREGRMLSVTGKRIPAAPVRPGGRRRNRWCRRNRRNWRWQHRSSSAAPRWHSSRDHTAHPG